MNTCASNEFTLASNVSSIRLSNEYDDDLRRQEVEILKSIFDENFIVDTKQPNFYQIKVFVDVPQDFLIKTESESSNIIVDEETTSTTDNGNAPTSNVEEVVEKVYPIVCLPAITLGFELPEGYPNEAPHLVISCCWLSLEQMNSIINELNSMWESGEMVIFKYVDWLKNNLFSFLSIEKSLTLSSTQVDFNSPLFDYCIWECNQDWTSLVSALPLILANNAHESKKIFNTSTHTCPICFCDDIGTNFDLYSCGHFTCNSCTRQICNLNIESGSITQIKCSDPKCGKPLDQNIVQKCVTQKNFEQYKSGLKRNSGFVECTRCRGWAKVEMHSRSTFCEACYFSMCMLCTKKWHPGVTCNYTAQPTRYTPYFNEKTDTFTFNKDYKPCPSCTIVVTKIEGCNKIVCSYCNKIFCWICLSVIQGYDHFQKKCQLFEIPSHMNDRRPRFDPMIYERITGNTFCVRCKARVYRNNNNNHMFCFNCKSEQCYLCRATISGTKHFSQGICQQHGGEPPAK